MNIIRFFLLLCSLLVAQGSFAQIGAPISQSASPADKIHWISLQDLEKIYQGEGLTRKTYFYFTASWCVFCKEMEKKTFQDTMIANYLNEHVYAVKINMECRDTVSFKGKTYYPSEYAGGGVHSLVNELCVKRVGFPGNVFYDETLRFINSSSGYLEPFQLQVVTAYFAEGYYMQCSYEWFTEHYRPENFFGKRAAPVPPEPR